MATFPFFLVTNDLSATLADGATADLSVTIPANVRFTAQEIRAVADIDDVTDVNPAGFDVKLQDTGVQQNYSNDFIPRQAICGSVNGGNTGLLPLALVLSGGTTVTFTVKNTSGGNIVSLRLILVGIREQ